MADGRAFGVEVVLAAEGVPTCPDCGALVRPDVVLDEEPLDPAVLGAAAVDAVASADCLIVGGTSFNVHPAAGLVGEPRGGRLVLLSRTPTPCDRLADLVLRSDLGRVLPAAAALLRAETDR